MKPKHSITIEDIAAQAGVSISTVSRVINNTAPVAERTKRKVLDIIESLGYKPNLFAQSLAGGQSKTIGVLTQLIGSPFYDVILRGILRGIEGTNYSTLFADGSWDAKKDRVALNMFRQRQVDGLILLDSHLATEDIFDIAEEMPIIMIGRSIPELENQCIPFDDFDAAYKATKFLIESGHQQIAHITGLLNHNDAIERRDGYLKALKDSGVSPDPHLIIEGDFTEPSGMMATEMLLMQGQIFSAIFAANDQMAIGARLALYRRGLRVPEDVSIVGFDDQPPSSYMIPPLTTMQRSPLEMGEKACKALLNLIQKKPISLPNHESKLIIRESVIRRL
jgi:LacI family transcriptional regulator